jgi:hypothetical protein
VRDGLTLNIYIVDHAHGEMERVKIKETLTDVIVTDTALSRNVQYNYI